MYSKSFIFSTVQATLYLFFSAFCTNCSIVYASPECEKLGELAKYDQNCSNSPDSRNRQSGKSQEGFSPITNSGWTQIAQSSTGDKVLINSSSISRDPSGFILAKVGIIFRVAKGLATQETYDVKADCKFKTLYATSPIQYNAQNKDIQLLRIEDALLQCFSSSGGAGADYCTLKTINALKSYKIQRNSFYQIPVNNGTISSTVYGALCKNSSGTFKK